MGLLRDINILSAPNNSTHVTNVAAQRGPARENERRPRRQKHQHHNHKSSKHRCH
jgi:hypothetical protein